MSDFYGKSVRVYSYGSYSLVFVRKGKEVMFTIFQYDQEREFRPLYRSSLRRGLPRDAFILDSGSRLVLVEDDDATTAVQLQVISVDLPHEKHTELLRLDEKEFDRAIGPELESYHWYDGVYRIYGALGELQLNSPELDEKAYHRHGSLPSIRIDYRNGKIVGKMAAKKISG